jgi:CheY-like chemotaxis protein
MAHVLIADDEPTVADLLTRMLARLGHSAQVAGDGLAALECLEQRPFDLLITDLDMPRLGGAALMRVLATRPQRPRILMVSGGAINPQTCALADGFLVKPFGLPEVTAAVAGLFAPGGPAPLASVALVATSAYPLS